MRFVVTDGYSLPLPTTDVCYPSLPIYLMVVLGVRPLSFDSWVL